MNTGQPLVNPLLRDTLTYFRFTIASRPARRESLASFDSRWEVFRVSRSVSSRVEFSVSDGEEGVGDGVAIEAAVVVAVVVLVVVPAFFLLGALELLV
jgi:hypothetical protein